MSHDDFVIVPSPITSGSGISMKYSSSLFLRLITHNIRYATSSPFKNEEPWPTRAPRLINELLFTTANDQNSFICLQEVLHDQLLDILQGLNAKADPEWDYIGVGRDDGERAGEYSPIFYRPSVWRLDDFETLWLSETPDVPSKGWDAGSIRILTTGVFTHRESRRRLVAMNTHLDNEGSVSRLESARIIMNQIDRLTFLEGGQRQLPVFLAGDFNSEVDQEAYKALNAESSPIEDLETFMNAGDRYGNSNTFTGFSSEDGPPSKIDFLFLGRRGKEMWKVQNYAVLANRFDDGVFLSDHRAVVGDVVLEGEWQ
ncbi:endonuclease/exonuclease/phosphatase [Aulographum hederae CBS 113979]|uniref:Endonuclease/exonuclease/phosphatase n=1 Tax=Aulographum hederae CBS 113979 TaxID=1176131 RepID=A0A6G1GU99_9PEZI|nr:endonuclease/exonuclease/phosphatase [Aulographum hederae CBS 113979]